MRKPGTNVMTVKKLKGVLDSKGISLYKLSRLTGIKYELLRRTFNEKRKLTADEIDAVESKSMIWETTPMQGCPPKRSRESRDNEAPDSYCELILERTGIDLKEIESVSSGKERIGSGEHQSDFDMLIKEFEDNQIDPDDIKEAIALIKKLRKK